MTLGVIIDATVRVEEEEGDEEEEEEEGGEDDGLGEQDDDGEGEEGETCCDHLFAHCLTDQDLSVNCRSSRYYPAVVNCVSTDPNQFRKYAVPFR